MALLTAVFSRIKKLFVVLLSVLKKPFCCRKRNRRNSGLILPMTVEKTATTDHSFNTYQPLNTALNNSRTDWPQTQTQTSGQSAANPYNTNYSSHKTNFQSNPSVNTHINPNPNPNPNNRVEEAGEQPDVDFFADMVPEFKRPKKILLASNQSMDSTSINRFGVDAKATIFQSKELGVIEHYEDGSGSWEDSTANEMWDTDQTLKSIRQQEREKKIAEHQRIKMEKEFKRSKQQKSNLLATKIS